jgi:hypothetical protein
MELKRDAVAKAGHASSRMKRKAYEEELEKLQTELVPSPGMGKGKEAQGYRPV